MNVIIIVGSPGPDEDKSEAEHTIYNQDCPWSEEECVEWLSRNDPSWAYLTHRCEEGV